nr:integrase, catalytic region, zinc finger, CCHC-type, peptidase aspartic, catalytic [Tanacetum cinerariifolium]
MAWQCTQPKRQRNAAWYKEKGMIAKAQEAGQILDEKQLAFFADPGIPAGQAQTIIPHNAAFQTEDLDTYDSDCDDMDNQTQRMKPTLYDGIVISEKLVAMHVIDNEETLILEEESRSKMFEKAKDPEVIAKKIYHKPINYEKLNRLTDDFGKCLTLVEVPSEVPTVSLVNESLKKLKFQLAQFDSVVKKRTTPNAVTEGIVEQAKAKQPLDNELYFACKHAKRIQKLLVMFKTLVPVPLDLVKLRLSRLYSGIWTPDVSKHMTGNRSQLMNFVSKFLGTVRFRNNQIARIIRYGDYQLRNIVISKVYYVVGLGHNLFSVGQFCDADLEVAFRKNTCFIRDLEGVDLILGSRNINLYTISLDYMLKSSLICLLSKASKTKSR